MTNLGLCAGVARDPKLASMLRAMGFQSFRQDLYAMEPGKNAGILQGAVDKPWTRWNFVTHGGFFTKLGNDIPLGFMEAQNAFDSTWRLVENYLKTYPFLEHQWSLECGNEPSLAPTKSAFKDPRVAAAYFNYCHGIVRGAGYHELELLTPAPHNLDRTAGFAYLKEMLAHIQLWDANCTVALHRYVPSRHGGPQPGWESRAHEQNALDALMSQYGQMTYSITETGISQLRKVRRGFPLCWLPKKLHMLTQTEQGSCIMSELLHWKGRAKDVYLYQLNSGPDPKNQEDHYGIRDHKGAWKGYAFLMQDVSNNLLKGGVQ